MPLSHLKALEMVKTNNNAKEANPPSRNNLLTKITDLVSSEQKGIADQQSPAVLHQIDSSKNATFVINGSFTHGKDQPLYFKESKQNFSFVDLIPHGFHHFSLYMLKGGVKALMLESKFFLDPRDKEIQLHTWDTKGLPKMQKTFSKQRSVFRDFRLDNPDVYRRAFEADWKFNKIPKFIRRAEEVAKIRVILYEHYPALKSIFMNLACNPSYPSVDWKAFLQFVDQCGFIDEHATMHEIDRAFVATNIELEKLDDNPDRELCRYEFLELVCRIGIIKYFDSKILGTYSAAVAKFLAEDVIPKAANSNELYDGYRFKNIYTVEMDELFKANLDGLDRFYRTYKTVIGIHIDKLKEIVEQAAIKMDDDEFIVCFVHSKMTVVDEMSEGKYLRREVTNLYLLISKKVKVSLLH